MSAMMPLRPEFVTADQVPPNLLGLKPGDVLTPRADTVRRVVRVGYRLHAKDFDDEVMTLLDSPEARTAAFALQTLCGAPVELGQVVARALVAARKFGGPERGLHIESMRLDHSVMVASTRRVVLGSHYPASGGWSHGPDHHEYEYESGGLTQRRTAVLVCTEYGEMISGDFIRAASE